MLKLVQADEIAAQRIEPVTEETAAVAREILEDVRSRGWPAIRSYAERFGDLGPGEPAIAGPRELRRALDQLDAGTQKVLERARDRIQSFADAQRRAIRDVVHPIPGGSCGLRYAPVQTAGCYAPGGRFPLPSSVLMTACTARAAGVQTVWVASPRPAPATLAAAALAGADAVLCVGGAQAIGAFAFGAGDVPAADAICGPGNRFVTAAKQAVAGRVAIDMLAGPSELLIIADHSADPARVAADLLAQAEHDPEARPMLIALAPSLVDAVRDALTSQLGTLPTADIARAALHQGWVTVTDADGAVRLSDRIAPEHVALHTESPDAIAARLAHYGALFIGDEAAEVLGDYGAGPNHTLPTAGTARSFGALSVLTFLRAQTWLRIEDRNAAESLVEDSAALARVEGLEAHARAAAQRL